MSIEHDASLHDIVQHTEGSLVAFWRFIFVFGFAVPALYFLKIVFLAQCISPVEGWEGDLGHGFMAAAVTGGAIQIEGHSLTPRGFGGRFLAAITGACGVGLYGFMVTIFRMMVPNKIEIYLSRRSTTAKKAMVLLVAMAFVLLFVQCAFAALCAFVIAELEDWDYWTTFKTIADMQLGGGMPLEIVVPQHLASELIYCLVSFWGIGLETILISWAGIPCNRLMTVAAGKHLQQNSSRPILRSLRILCLIVVVLIPIALGMSMCVVAPVLIAYQTESDFKSAFFSALPVVSGGAASVVSANMVRNKVEESLLVLSATIGYLMLSMWINFGGNFTEPLHVAVGLGKKQNPRIWHGILALALSVLIYIPAFVFILAIPVGGLLAAVEAWPFLEGWWWVVAAELGGGMSLSDGVISSFAGMVLGTLTAAWSIGVAILAVSFAGAPAVEPFLTWISGAVAIKAEGDASPSAAPAGDGSADKQPDASVGADASYNAGLDRMDGSMVQIWSEGQNGWSMAGDEAVNSASV